MNKRGQVAIFVIVGLVVLIVAALLWFLDSQDIVPILPSSGSAVSKLESIQSEVVNCVQEGAIPGLVLFGNQGASFNSNKYLQYNNYKVKYLCTNIPNKKSCLNHLPMLEDIKIEFEEYVKDHMLNCVNAKNYEDSDYKINVGEMEVGLEFGNEVILINVDYDVYVEKEGESANLPEVTVPVAIPFKELYNVAYDIIQAKATTGYFDQLVYMVQKKGMYEINVDKPYPDVVYKINKKNNDYEFWFAIEGEGEYIL